MNLFYSSITSLLIVGAIWFVALSQPAANAGGIDPTKNVADTQVVKATEPAATTKQAPAKAQPVKASLPKRKDFSGIEIVGNTQTTSLSNLDALLVAFSANESINAKLYQQPSKIYIYYRDFSPSFDSAKITVGYNKTELVGPTRGAGLPSVKFETLLNKGDYTDTDIVNAWQNIDYGKNPQAVLEVHYLNKDGSTGKNELLVSYEQGA